MKKATKQPYSIFSPVFLICTMAGLGKIPIMPGTIGSLVAAIEFSFYITHIKSIFAYIGYLIVILPVITYCIFAYCKNTGNQDPKEVIIDEYYGQYIAQLFSYIICYQILSDKILMYLLIVISFLLFRIFDISKISLVGYCDKNIKNAFGVLLDDIVAGFFAAISCSIMVFIIYFIYFKA